MTISELIQDLGRVLHNDGDLVVAVTEDGSNDDSLINYHVRLEVINRKTRDELLIS